MRKKDLLSRIKIFIFINFYVYNHIRQQVRYKMILLVTLRLYRILKCSMSNSRNVHVRLIDTFDVQLIGRGRP